MSDFDHDLASWEESLLVDATRGAVVSTSSRLVLHRPLPILMTSGSSGSASRHLAALEYFLQVLLGNGVKDRIAKLILFGSVGAGEATPESDVDLLVLATDDLEGVSQACAEASLRTAMEMGVSVEPLVYCLDPSIGGPVGSSD